MIDASRLLAGLPKGLREELIDSYREIVRNFLEHRWEPSELRGGWFAEVAYSIVKGAVAGNFPARASKPSKMVDACRALENTPANSALVGDKSLRVFIPRALIFLYDVRNNRGVGHVGGDVNANNMDASAVVALASWVMAELVRIFHGVSIEEAQETVDALAERKTPLIWEVEDVKRVLDHTMTAKDQVLVLLHHTAGWVQAADLKAWVEYKNPTDFRKIVLSDLHKLRFIEFDAKGDRARISPKGTEETERRLLKKSSG